MMIATTGRQRILLHLLRFKNILFDSTEMPFGTCQEGISQAVDLRQARVSIYLREFVKKNFIKTETSHIKGLDYKRKTYLLTQKGFQKALSLEERLNEQTATVRTLDGEETIKLGEIEVHIDSTNPLLTALNQMDDSGVIDLTFSHQEEQDMFVGRHDEMNRLKEILEDVLKEGSKTVLISGEAGIGKSRLVSEFRKHVEEKGVKFLSGRAYYGTSEPYLPLREALEDHFDESLIEDKPLFLLGVKEGAVVTEKQKLNGQRKYLWYDLGKMLEEMASDKPLVIFLDDLQWADRSTVLVINYLANKISGSPMLFIGTYRPEDIDDSHPVNELISHLTRENLLEKIDLEPLEKKYVRKITQRLIGRRDVPNHFIEVLYGVTDGNPLFTRECVKYMLEEGDIDIKSDRYPTERDEVNIPDIVEGVIDRRIRNLEDPDTSKLLQLGAVIGDTVPFELLNHCVDMDVLDILDNVEKLMKYGLWYELPEEYTFSFSHGLIQKSVYESIPNNLRKSLHLHVAEKIERVYKDENHRYWSNLGFHYERGEKFEEAVDCYVSAGDEAKNMYAHEDAVDMYEKALRLMEGIESKADEKASVIEQIGDTYKVLGEYEKSLEYYEEIIDSIEPSKNPSIYRKIAQILFDQGKFERSLSCAEKGLEIIGQDKEEMCRLLLVKGLGVMMRGEVRDSIEIIKTEIDVAKKIDNKSILANGYHNLARIHHHQSDDESSRKYLNNAIELREETGDKKGLSLSYNNLANIYLRQWDFNNALKYYQKSLELAEEMGMNYHLGSPAMNIGVTKQHLGELEEARVYYEKSKVLFEMSDQRMNIVLVNINLSRNSIRCGDLKDAYDQSQKGYSLAKEIDFKRGLFLSLLDSVMILRMMGELDESMELLNESIKICDELGNKKYIAETYLQIGDVQKDKGDLEKAIKSYTDSKNIYEETIYEHDVAVAENALAETYLLLENMDKARYHLENSTEIAEKMNDHSLDAKNHRLRGMLKRKEGDHETALDELNRSKVLYQKLSERPKITEVEFEIGRTMIKKGDKKQGLSIINDARNEFDNMGMVPMKKKCEEYFD